MCLFLSLPSAHASTVMPPRVELIDDSDDDNAATGRQVSAWERAYEADRAWEELEEDEFGRLKAADPTVAQRAKRKRLLDEAASARIRRGMIRYCLLCVDLSTSVNETDLRPSRLALLSTLLPAFIRSFFGANPLSHLGVMVARNGVAERITELSGSPEAHVKALGACLQAANATGGSLSLQNALEQATSALSSIPPYGTRELVILQSALSTCDPGNIHQSVAAAKAARVRVSVIGLAAEMHIAHLVCELTGGVYGVACGETHLEELLNAHAPPPPQLATSTSANLVRMGFPQRRPVDTAGYFCAGSGGDLVCPQCRARVAELPGTCPVCTLTLVSSPHLARSYHHLFPVPPFDEIAPEVRLSGQHARCYGCFAPLDTTPDDDSEAKANGVRVRCPTCGLPFCFACDAFIHEQLHNCPGCEAGDGRTGTMN